MKFNLNKKIILIPITTLLFNFPVLAVPNFRDVSKTHWAYDSIVSVSTNGLIIGDTSGNFHPNSNIDKFEMSRILARASGFSRINPTDEERAFYNKALENNKGIIQNFVNNFSTWNSTANEEISFLLEKDILTPKDLNQFVILDTNNNERYRAVSREEAAVFLVKLFNKQEEALNFSSTFKFNDHANITESYKPYIYFLHKNGVINGENEGNFNPGAAVTKASLSVMLDKTMSLFEDDLPSLTPNINNNENINQVSTISGNIDKIYPSLDVIQIEINNQKQMFKIATQAAVYINSELKTINELQEGMNFVGVINNNTLISIRAMTNQITLPEPEKTDETPPISPIINDTVLDGIISSVEEKNGRKTVSLEVKTISPNGNVNTIINTYVINSATTITRGTEDVTFNDILLNDIAQVTIKNGILASINLQDIAVKINGGTLTEKRTSLTNNTPILVISDKDDNKYEFQIASNSYISRAGLGTTTWNNLRIGDTVDLKAEYGVINELSASGIRSTLEGTVEALNITQNGASVTIRDIDNTVKTYELSSEIIDSYSIRVGSKVRLRLDSNEIENIIILESPQTTMLTGTVYSKTSNTITLNDVSSQAHRTVNIEVDNSTIIVDSRTGDIVSLNNIRNGSKLYIVYAPNSTRLARTITILS